MVRARQTSTAGSNDDDVRDGTVIHHVEVPEHRNVSYTNTGILEVGLPLDHRSRNLGLFDGCEAVVAVIVLRNFIMCSVVVGETVLLCLKNGRLLELGDKGDGRGHSAIDVECCCSMARPGS